MNLNIDHARSRSLMICTPVARQFMPQYMLSMVQTIQQFAQLGIRVQAQFVIGSSNLPQARNQLVAEFLASGLTDMIFIDDDIGWPWAGALRLLASPHDIIAAIARKKNKLPNSDPSVWCWHPKPPPLNMDQHGAIEILGAGTGFMRISREALQRIIAKNPGRKRAGHPQMSPEAKAQYHRLFEFGDDGEIEAGEDLHFCELARSSGETIWADPSIELIHAGDHEYVGRLIDLLTGTHSTVIPGAARKSAAERGPIRAASAARENEFSATVSFGDPIGA